MLKFGYVLIAVLVVVLLALVYFDQTYFIWGAHR